MGSVGSSTTVVQCCSSPISKDVTLEPRLPLHLGSPLCKVEAGHPLAVVHIGAEDVGGSRTRLMYTSIGEVWSNVNALVRLAVWVVDRGTFALSRHFG